MEDREKQWQKREKGVETEPENTLFCFRLQLFFNFRLKIGVPSRLSSLSKFSVVKHFWIVFGKIASGLDGQVESPLSRLSAQWKMLVCSICSVVACLVSMI
uniref:Uncharacterized protein LOC104215438 n=1 Tax=Nicotiana sylvestris TaxID=4096 RepID=A0A1U7VF74_NICSY|nr:PREDICTED: uncharacterized protein LOC104215438 [Nicotiana sylvestris]